MQISSVLIERAGARGVSIGKSPEGQVILVTGGAPGDVCTVQIVRKKKGHLEGRVTRIEIASPLRVAPVCQHFGLCGGCKWQHVSYAGQLEFKEAEVRQSLERIGKVTGAHYAPIVPAPEPYGYRNKMEYTFTAQRFLTFEELNSDETFTDRRGVGFHVPGLWDKVIDLKECALQNDTGNAIRLFLREYGMHHSIDFYHLREQIGFLRTVTLRNNRKGEWMVILLVGRDEPDAVKALVQSTVAAFPSIVSFYVGVNGKGNDSLYDVDLELHHGLPHLEERMEATLPGGTPLLFRIGPKSFYQTNPVQAEKLYHTALEMADISSSDRVYDLYTGTGTIALFMAQKAHYVAGIESVPEAIEAARENAIANNIQNVAFEVGDMRNAFSEAFVQRHGAPQLIVTDPPRDGMHPKVVEQLLSLQAPRIVYVSCNSATQARDLELLQSKYTVDNVQAVDMFPQTHHIESVARLTLRNEFATFERL